MLKHNFRIARLISGHIAESLTAEEEQELSEWRSESAEHEQLFRQISRQENIVSYLYDTQKFSKEKGWDEVNKRIQTTLRRRYTLQVIRYAAVILFPLLIGTVVLTLQNRQEEKEQLAFLEQQATEFIPGERKALLTLGSGQVIDLQQADPIAVDEQDGTIIDIDQSTLSYQAKEKKKKNKEVLYNKIDIPHGGEYSLYLSDGTKVYLNAMSSLRFPVQFSGETRQVELTGEAYFEVTKDTKPFIVCINEMQIEVLGTSFNVSAYPHELSHTTLVNGSVKVVASESGEQAILRPSEQAVFDTQTDQITVSTVDVALYTSWISGKIYFRDECLEEIMKSLSRWYDMEVVYADEQAKKIRFGCNLNRYEQIGPFLELLEKTDKVKITVEGKKILIRTKK